MLLGEEDTQHQSVLQSAPFIFACMAKPLADRALVRQDIATALAQASLQPFLTRLTGQQLAWLQRHMQLTAESHAQVSLLPHLTDETFDKTPACERFVQVHQLQAKSRHYVVLSLITNYSELLHGEDEGCVSCLAQKNTVSIKNSVRWSLLLFASFALQLF